MSASIQTELDSYGAWFNEHLASLVYRSLATAALARQKQWRIGRDFGFLSSNYEWNYRIHQGSFGGLSGNDPVSAQLMRLLIETGIALSPSIPEIGDLRAGYAAVRYSEYFRRNSRAEISNKLILNNDPVLKSQALRRIMAEELSCGIACYLIRTVLNVVDISEYEIPSEGMFPDYYCVDEKGHASIVEVKGTIKDRSDPMYWPRSRGRAQVRAAKFREQPERPEFSRFVISTCLLLDSDDLDDPNSITHIDCLPEELTSISTGQRNSAPRIGLRLIQERNVSPRNLSYAKFFRYLGQDQRADWLLGKTSADNWDYKVKPVWFFGSPYKAVGVDPFQNIAFMQVGVFENLFSVSTTRNELSIEKITREGSELHERQAIVLNNGILFTPNPDCCNLSDDRKTKS